MNPSVVAFMSIGNHIYDAGASVVSTSVFGPGSGPVVLDDIVCSGTEQELLECAHAGIGNHICGRAVFRGLIQSEHEFDVAILCKGTLIYSLLV